MTVVALEGVHALKHAVRFGARITEILTDDPGRALATADQVAPDIRPLIEQATVLAPTRFRELSHQPIHTHVLAYAERPAWTLDQALPTAEHPTILLDDPRNSKNMGAVVRVGAAASAAGLLVNGPADVCDPMAVRGAAGLQWALPWWGSPDLMAQLDQIRAEAVRPTQLGKSDDPGPSHEHSDNKHGFFRLIGLDAGGTPFDPTIADPVIFAFGSERTGLSEAVRTRCDEIHSLPMRPHISSLNLATSVSAVLYVTLFARRSLTNNDG